jgi:hypothetical protein
VIEQLSSTPWLQRMHMNDLLSAAVNAHGGLSRMTPVSSRVSNRSLTAGEPRSNRKGGHNDFKT